MRLYKLLAGAEERDLGYSAALVDKGNGKYDYQTKFPVAEFKNGVILWNTNPALADLSRLPLGTLSNGEAAFANELRDIEIRYGLREGSVNPWVYPHDESGDTTNGALWFFSTDSGTVTPRNPFGLLIDDIPTGIVPVTVSAGRSTSWIWYRPVEGWSY